MEEETIITEEGTEQETEQVEEEYTQETEQEEIEQDPSQNNNESVPEVQETTESPDYMYIQSDQLELTNHMLAGQIFFTGLIFGVLLFKIFWDRWKI